MLNNEYWTVRGSFNGSKDFDTLEEAEAYFEEVSADEWSSDAILVHHHVVKTKASLWSQRMSNG